MRTSYKTLTADEYNVLNLISSRTKMDCWFLLKQDKSGTDYVFDIESQRRLCLKTGVSWLAEGLDYYDIYKNCQLNCFEDLTFRELLKKLNISFDIPYNGPVIQGMPKQEFIDYCKENNVEFKKYGDEILVGDRIYQFDREEKCFSIVALNLDKSMRLETRSSLDEQIDRADKTVKEQYVFSADKDISKDITR